MVSRIVNEYILDLFSKYTKIPFIVYEAPTGYGKTSLSPFIYQVLEEKGLVAGLIHVLPLRNLVEKLYLDIKNGKGVYGKLEPRSIGYQAMMFIDSSKAPFYLKDINVSTFDSYAYNLLRVPVAEFHKYGRHYDVPRATIFTSLNTLDEAHLYGGDPGISSTGSIYTVFDIVVHTLYRSLTPTLVLSATLPNPLKKDLLYVIKDLKSSRHDKYYIEYEAFTGEAIDNNLIKISDEEFDHMVMGVDYKTEIINEPDILCVVDKHVSSSEKVLIIRNTPSKAVSTYDALAKRYGEEDTVLIHGRLTSIDRLKAIEKLDRAKIVVATQVIEAGIDISFDTLISDVASPSPIVQRIGRVNRYFDSDKAYIYIVRGSGDRVYDQLIVNRFLDLVDKLLSRGYSINWRLALSGSKDSVYGYKYVFDKVYEGYSLYKDYSLWNILGFISRSTFIDQHMINELMYRMCCQNRGFVRDSILVPIYVGEYRKDLSIEEILNYSIPVSKHFIERHPYLVVQDNRIHYIGLKYDAGEWTITRDFIPVYGKAVIPCSLLFGYRGDRAYPLAFLISDSKYYVEGRGLIIGG